MPTMRGSLDVQEAWLSLKGRGEWEVSEVWRVPKVIEGTCSSSSEGGTRIILQGENAGAIDILLLPKVPLTLDGSGRVVKWAKAVARPMTLQDRPELLITLTASIYFRYITPSPVSTTFL